MSDSPRSRRPQRTGRSDNPNRKRSDAASGQAEKRGFGTRRSLSDAPSDAPSDTSGRPKKETRGGHKKGRPATTRGGRPQKFRPKKRAPLKDANAPIRLNKFISNSGVCARREADLLITAGAVSVNGEIITALGAKVMRTDEVVVEGQRIKPEAKHYLPPKAYVWRSVSGKSGWHGHLAPNPRVGCFFGAGAAATWPRRTGAHRRWWL